MNDKVVKAPVLDRQNYARCQREALKLWVVLARCYDSFEQALALQNRAYDLTPPQFGVLEALAHLGPMKMCDIASKLLMSRANVTGVVDRLEKKDLARRVMDTADRRTFSIHLTEEGRRLIIRSFPQHAQHIEALTGSLSGSQKRLLIALLKKLGKGIQRPNS